MADIKKANFMNVLSIFQKISVEGDGCTIEQVAACAAQLPSSKNITMQQISEITNELLLEGHIYSTIDENTFKAIIEQPEQPKDLMLRIEELVRENSALKKQRDELMQAHVEKNRWFIPLLKGFKKFKKVVAVAAAAAEDEEDEEDEEEEGQEDEQEEGEEGEEDEEEEEKEEKLSKKRERDE
jgi:hypothetical protein